MHLPHLMHFAASMTLCPLTTVIAFFGQVKVQGREKHPRQFGVETIFASGHDEQAQPQTESGGCATGGSSDGTAVASSVAPMRATMSSK